MKSFTYTIKDSLGIHARPAGLLSKTARAYSAKCTLQMGDTRIDLTKLMALMTLGVTFGTTVTVTADGEDEDTAIAALLSFFSANL